jgi:hypothetical protein
MIERTRKPTDTKGVGVCMGRDKEHHNLQWEDMFWLDERSEK